MDLAWEFASMQLVHEPLDPKQPIPMFEIEVRIRTPPMKVTDCGISKPSFRSLA